ncbi:MAG: hypothetical protein P1U56_18065 [Saprospiraceae bacterium]|nr:hypothetical protein [Saprospiraceae bacterium]
MKKLEDDLRWDIEIIEEITFEDASSNWTPKEEFTLLFTDKATLIFYPHKWITECYSSVKVSSMSYAYSATSMTFIISYRNHEENYGRYIISSEGKTQLVQGNEIPYEKEGMQVDAIILKLIDDLLGEPFDKIDRSVKAYRCKKLNVSTTRLDYIQRLEIEKNRMQLNPNNGESGHTTNLFHTIENLELDDREEVLCPRCLGKGYIDAEDIERLNRKRAWEAGLCAYCMGKQKVSIKQSQILKANNGFLSSNLIPTVREKLVDGDKELLKTAQKVNELLENYLENYNVDSLIQYVDTLEKYEVPDE